MQINRINNFQIVQKQQTFKGSSANSGVVSNAGTYNAIPLNASKAYVSPQITQSYKEIETFDIPCIGKGKLYQLSNGHKVIIVPKNSKTYISTIVGAGFSDESADKKDVAHLTEHLLANYWFNEGQSSGIVKTLKETGATANANTNDCITYYHMATNVENNTDLENLMKIQLGILTNNNYNTDKIEKEKNILLVLQKIF